MEYAGKAPFHFVPLPKARSMRKPRSSGRTMIIDDDHLDEIGWG